MAVVKQSNGRYYVRITKPHIYFYCGQWIASGVGFFSDFADSYKNLTIEAQKWANKMNEGGKS